MLREARLAWRNVIRHRRRTASTAAAIAFAAAVILVHASLNAGVHEAMIEDAVRLGSGHLAVSGAGYRSDPTLERFVRFGPGWEAALASHDGVQGYAPRLLAFGLLSHEASTQGVAVIGVDPAREGTVSMLPERVREGRFVAGGGTRDIAIGSRLARNLDVGLGDVLLLYSVAYSLEMAYELFTVVGVLELPGAEMDRSLAVVSLADAQVFFAYGDRVSEVAILVDDAATAAPLGRELEVELAGLSALPLEIHSWRELMPQLAQFILLDDVGMWIVLGLLIVVVGSGVFNTILMSVMERLREFGVLLAVGLRPGALARLVFLEAAALAVLGTVLGLAIAIPVVLYLEAHPIALGGRVITVTESVSVDFTLLWKLEPWQPAAAAITVTLLGLLAALYPAFRASRSAAADALRSA